MTPARLRVSETFLSLQGEGPATGERALFLRLAGCNLACQACDTPYSWDWARYPRAQHERVQELRDVMDDLLGLAKPVPRLLVITGGEPLLQQAAIVGLLELLAERRAPIRAEVETNGTVLPSVSLLKAVHRFVVSPKLDYFAKGSRRPHEELGVLKSLARHAPSVLKIVLRDEADVPAARRLAADAGFEPHRVWVMPEGHTRQEIYSAAPQLAEDAVAEGWNFTTRLHIALWGDVVGR